MVFELSNPKDFLILVVDDYADNLKVLRVILERVGYRLTFARSGAQALERISTISPDLILLDLMMPDMDGLEVCNVLQRDPKFVSIPIIFLTASHEIEHLINAFKAGAVDYITKPFSQPELLARVQTHLELKHLRDRALRQAEQERIVNSITHGIYYSLKLQTVLHTAASELLAFLNADRVIIAQFSDRQGCSLLTEATSSHINLPSQNAEIPIDDAFAEAAQIQNWQVQANLPSTLPENHRQWLVQNGVKAELIVPIFQNQAPWGVLVAHRCTMESAWSADEVTVLERIVTQLAIAIQHSTLHEQLYEANQKLQYVAHTDSLTQVSNRRRFDEYFEQEWARSQREQLPIAFLLCDIDYFKQYNDCYGHLQGDWCLQQVAQAISKITNRPADLVARYGGEEFAVLLPNTELKGAVHVAQEIQRAIAQLNIPHRSSDLGPILTLSIGIASFQASHKHIAQDLIETADRALYSAKLGGRNRYIVGAPTVTSPPT